MTERYADNQINFPPTPFKQQCQQHYGNNDPLLTNSNYIIKPVTIIVLWSITLRIFVVGVHVYPYSNQGQNNGSQPTANKWMTKRTVTHGLKLALKAHALFLNCYRKCKLQLFLRLKFSLGLSEISCHWK